MLYVLVFVVCLLSSVVGGVCGIGGGVIIKPVVDAFNILSVSALSFLSGLCVLSMSCISVVQQRKSHLVEPRQGTLLALGAAIGGLAGKAVFDVIRQTVSETPVGLIHSILLAVVTLLTLIYMLNKTRIRTISVSHPFACLFIGFVLGMMSSFLGIGGGPINLCVLYYFFSMDTKKAASNSLYIILFSQIFSFLSTVIQGKIPQFPAAMLILMVAGGVWGGMLGHKLNLRLTATQVEKLFNGLLCLIIIICIYNALRFAGAL